MPGETKKRVWDVARTRHIPAVLPLFNYFSWPLSEIGVNEGTVVNIWEEGNYTALRNKESTQALGEYAFNYLWKNRKQTKKVQKKGVDTGIEVIAVLKKHAEKITSKKDILSFLKLVDKEYPRVMKTNMIFWLYGGPVVEKKIKEKLKGNKDAEKILNALTKPWKSYTDEEEERFLQLQESVKKFGLNSPETKKKIDAFVKKYFWFPYEYVGPNIWDEAAIKKRIKEEKPQIKTWEDTPIPKEVKELGEVLCLIAQLQDDRKMIHSHVCYFINGVFMEKVAKILGISLAEARYLDHEMFEKLMAHPQALKRELKERTKYCVIIQEAGKNTALTREDAKAYVKSLGLEEAKETTELKGNIANKGYHIGTVKIVKLAGDGGIKEGDVLITGMTTPDFGPLIKKAGAIVTDEGGITCHAAIVSRELGKPCIIGTKFATKVFKDGDKVEVDANKGIVRKLQ